MTAEAVKAQAHALGFDLCGIAPAAAFPELGGLRRWLDRGFAGTMHYLARTAERRADVREVMPSARSVIVTGTIYNVDRPPRRGQAEPGRALIARYAWGDDYHDVLGRRLDALIAWMRVRSAEPFDARAYVDTGPVQERVYAQYAGIGWVGKNTCLINAEVGSWIFLAEILCSLPLEPDVPALDQCGGCTKCLEACPTGALVEPRVMDATRCLSYLTIEQRDDIPLELRDAIGAHAYGCDICQDVCPWNRQAPVSTDPAWQPRGPLDSPRLADLWRLDDEALRKTLKGSPMKRAGLRGLRRNLAVAIGNHGDADALEALDERPTPGPTASSTFDDPLVAEHVAWAKRRATACDGARPPADRPA